MALIVEGDGPVVVVWANVLTEDALANHVYGAGPTDGSYAQAYSAWRANQGNPALGEAWKAKLQDMLSWLGDVIVLRLGRMLAHIRASEACLVAFGPLSLLPLHAISGLVRFSYAPNARLVGDLRGGHMAQPGSVLSVEDPEAEGTIPLPLGRLEVDPFLWSE